MKLDNTDFACNRKCTFESHSKKQFCLLGCEWLAVQLFCWLDLGQGTSSIASSCLLCYLKTAGFGFSRARYKIKYKINVSFGQISFRYLPPPQLSPLCISFCGLPAALVRETPVWNLRPNTHWAPQSIITLLYHYFMKISSLKKS